MAVSGSRVNVVLLLRDDMMEGFANTGLQHRLMAVLPPSALVVSTTWYHSTSHDFESCAVYSSENACI